MFHTLDNPNNVCSMLRNVLSITIRQIKKKTKQKNPKLKNKKEKQRKFPLRSNLSETGLTLATKEK